MGSKKSPDAPAPPIADAPSPLAGPRRVRALKAGYAGTLLREVGEVFVLRPGEPFSSKWMEDAPLDVPVTRAAAPPPREVVQRLQPNAADPIVAPTGETAATGDAHVLD